MTPEILKLAASISPQTVAKCRAPAQSLADRNEAKYGGDDEPERDPYGVAERYNAIHVGFDNGDCTTRAGTWRRFKTGDGRRGGPR